MNEELPSVPDKKPNLWTKLLTWVKSHKKLSLIITGVFLIVVTGGVAAFIYFNQPKPEAPKPAVVAKKVVPPPVYYSPLTGNVVPTEAATTQAVTAIMIENSPDARPQSGLKDAGVIYEAVAEGGITRFLTLHQEDKPQLIGPVRSLRMYYVDWLAPYNASVAHVGGSAAALAEIRNGNYRDIDQFFNAGSYWRATDRYAPHNVYTSFDKLDKLNAFKGYTSSSFTGFKRTNGKPAETPNATSIAINISSPLYNTTYSYDKDNNRYNRNLAGVPHMDREGGQITPSVVIAMNVDMTLVMEDGYRESITTTGSGSATIFQNGTIQNVTWTKKDRASQLVFTDVAGKEVPLVRGQTWISAVPNSTGGVTWQ